MSWAEDQGYDGYDIDYIIEYREQQLKQQKEVNSMGEKISKSVWAQKTTTYGQNTYTNVLLSDEKWYGLGAEYKCEDGDGITLEFTTNEKGFLNAVKGTVQIFPGKGTKQPKTGGSKGGGGAAPKKAWSGGGGAKGSPDHVQIAIMAQSAQKAAVDIVIAALGAEKLKLPTKKQDHFDAIVGYTDVLTDMFLAKTAGIMLKVKDGLAIADLINTLPVEVSSSIEKDTKVVQEAAKAPSGAEATNGFVENTPAEVDAAISGFVETADTDFVEG